MPLFSIIIPVYNVEKYIDQCVESVLHQTYQNFEVVLVDDGSTDNCPSICDEFAIKDKRVKVIHKQNGGSSDARNSGINCATGTYLLFLDSDDYWKDHNFLSGLSDLIANNPTVDVINFGWTKYYQLSERYDEDKRNFSLNKPDTDSKEKFIINLIENDLFVASAWNKCIRTKFVRDNNLYFKKGIRSEDMDWCGNILYSMPSMLCYDNKGYIYRQQRIDSITATVEAGHISDIILMIKDAVSKAKNLDPDKQNIYLSFFAVQFLTLIYNVNAKPMRNHRDLIRETEQLKSILKFDLNRKVKLANKLSGLLGFRLMSRLLQYYTNYKMS